MSEHAWLARLAARSATPPAGAGVLLGIGDDAAAIDPGEGALLLTVDASVDGVHFTRAFASLGDIGYRATMAASSDIAAMGGRVRVLLSSLTVPTHVDESALDELVAGQLDACRELGATLVGGNVSRASVLSITTTVVGQSPPGVAPLGRQGATPGEGVFVFGRLGLAAAGFRALERGLDATHSNAIAACIAAWRRPRAWLDAGREAVASASTGIDVSDGLAQDAGHIASASRVTLVLDEASVLEAAGPELREAATSLDEDPALFALAGGEDYALVVTARAPPAAAWRRIGWVEEGDGRVVIWRNNQRVDPPTGFDHLRETLRGERPAYLKWQAAGTAAPLSIPRIVDIAALAAAGLAATLSQYAPAASA